MASKSKKQKLIIRLLKAPFQILARAGDFYVRSLTECSGHIGMVCPTGQVIATLPRSYSVSSSHDDDFRELVRAASTKSLNSVRKHEQRQQQQPPPLKLVLPRSFSSGIGRIDEEKASEFGDEAVARPACAVYRRSRSCAVYRRSVAGLP
ncbi:hypothetical protein SAY87_022588 [Trapa incisa]|uniref:Uncharacterized protein n=1 Tax=Trapa incisa TaxID=236973 RepID=A0AAN7K8E1_9MYRT|nr:hypothetical protein SAY87_022588 [Trapa incisa]